MKCRSHRVRNNGDAWILNSAYNYPERNTEKLSGHEEAIVKLITCSGSARSRAFHALRLAGKGRFNEARQQVRAAKEDLGEGHRAHAGLIQKEASAEEPLGADLLMVHAQDHLMTAMLAVDLIEELIVALEELMARDDKTKSTSSDP